MKIANKKLFLIAMLFAHFLHLRAQDSDWGLWTTIDAETKLFKKWDISFGPEYRMKNNFSATDQIRGNLDISRKVGKYVKLGAGYIFIADKKTKRDIFEYRHRFLFQATGSYKYARFTASWRSRIQLTIMETDQPRGNLFDDDSYNWVWRNRFGLKYNIKKSPFTPYINFEMFHSLFSDLQYSYMENRFSVGTEYQINKRNSLEFGYKLDSEVEGTKKHKLNVLKLGYIYSF